MAREEFLILPHPAVKKYLINKVSDYERWLNGMRKLKRSLSPNAARRNQQIFSI